MESVLESISKNANKTYRNIRSTAPVVVDKFPAGHLEFFYIGKNPSIIHLLVNHFETGYVAESPSNALSMLHRITRQNNRAPHVIIADAGLGVDALTEFYHRIHSENKLTAIPFILDGSGAEESILRSFRSCFFIDEIVYLNKMTGSHLSNKIRFLQKIKLKEGQTAAKVELSGSAMCGQKCVFKRTFDIVISFLLLLILSPLFVLIALAIKIESRGPVFYISKRAGRGYRIFNFYKFRTMYAGSEERMQDLMHLNEYNDLYLEEGPVFFKANNDPRITRLGRFLRSSSLDELPQLINVIKGDMSIVGNRPLPLYEAETLTTDEWAQRFLAPAGITGLWQIKRRMEKGLSSKERIRMDIQYANRFNFAYDLYIMAKTPSALIQETKSHSTKKAETSGARNRFAISRQLQA